LLVHLSGFMTAEPWISRDGEAKASLKFRTDEINMLTSSARQNNKPTQAVDKNKVLKPSKEFN